MIAYDPGPVIISISSELEPLIVGQDNIVIIGGAYFGPNWGTVRICSPTGVCVAYVEPPWHDEEIDVPLTPLEAGSYDVTVCSTGWLGLGLEPEPGEPDCTEGAVEVVETGESVTVAMRLEQVGGTVISSDGKYSEDTTIRVTAVDASTGEILPSWTGTVNIAEKGTAIYSQNGGNLPSSVSITSGGTATLLPSLWLDRESIQTIPATHPMQHKLLLPTTRSPGKASLFRSGLFRGCSLMGTQADGYTIGFRPGRAISLPLQPEM